VKRAITARTKACTTLVLACSAALVVAVATVQARPAHTTGSRGATATAPSKCKIVIVGATWRIRAHVAGGSSAGNQYTLGAEGMSCSSARAWAAKFTHLPDTAKIKGPTGFRCQSFSLASSGDKLLYSGVCMHPPHNIPFFEWGPKVR
jgi:hypothetical protein